MTGLPFRTPKPSTELDTFSPVGLNFNVVSIFTGCGGFPYICPPSYRETDSTMNKLSPNEFNQEVEQFFKNFPALKYMKELIENLKGASNSEINQDLRNFNFFSPLLFTELFFGR